MTPIIGRVYEINSPDYRGRGKCIRKVNKEKEGYKNVEVDLWDFDIYNDPEYDSGIFDEEDIVELISLPLEIGKIYTNKEGIKCKLVFADSGQNKVILRPELKEWSGTVEEFNENFS